MTIYTQVGSQLTYAPQVGDKIRLNDKYQMSGSKHRGMSWPLANSVGEVTRIDSDGFIQCQFDDSGEMWPIRREALDLVEIAVPEHTEEDSLDNLRLRYYDYMIAAQERDESYLDYKAWLEDMVLKLQEARANEQADVAVLGAAEST